MPSARSSSAANPGTRWRPGDPAERGLTAVVCSGCGQTVYQCRDHSGLHATVIQLAAGAAACDGALIVSQTGAVYAVPAAMTRPGEALYAWHALPYAARGSDGRLHTPLAIACGHPVTERHRGAGWIDCAPLREES